MSKSGSRWPSSAVKLLLLLHAAFLPVPDILIMRLNHLIHDRGPRGMKQQQQNHKPETTATASSVRAKKISGGYLEQYHARAVSNRRPSQYRRASKRLHARAIAMQNATLFRLAKSIVSLRRSCPMKIPTKCTSSNQPHFMMIFGSAASSNSVSKANLGIRLRLHLLRDTPRSSAPTSSQKVPRAARRHRGRLDPAPHR